MSEASRTGDLAAGTVTAALGAGVVLYARRFPELDDGSPGPALFPTAVGGLLAVFGIVLAARWLVTRLRTTPVETPHPVDGAGTPAGAGVAVSRMSARAWVDAALVVGSVVWYVLVADLLGFAPTMAVLLFVLSWRLGRGGRRARVLVAAGTAVVAPVLIYLVFQRVLLVPLPAGPFG